ncbi:hypothetical protein GOODEAATRI_015556 [Goodea atripinnis]|uniref:Uncharacterized protein n=1 Tax=Goodea atripinnis TaxID=208336 RepID=A0ABV0NKU2_9TELE
MMQAPKYTNTRKNNATEKCCKRKMLQLQKIERGLRKNAANMKTAKGKNNSKLKTKKEKRETHSINEVNQTTRGSQVDRFAYLQFSLFTLFDVPLKHRLH